MLKAERVELLHSLVLALVAGVAASLLLGALALLLSADARADTGAEDGDRSSQGSGSLDVRTASGQVIRNVPRLNTDVSMRIDGLLARVRVKQRFINPSDEWVEAVYTFPLPTDSAVDHLRMLVDGRIIEGEIQEKQQARRTYEQARAQGKRASLLSQQRPNIFTSSVANVPPHEEVLVEIEYQQRVQYRDGEFSLRFPMVVGPRYIPGYPIAERTEGFATDGWGQATREVPDAAKITPPIIDQAKDQEAAQSYRNPVSMQITLNAGLPFAELHSPYHALTREGRDPARVRLRLADGEVPADRDFLLQWRLAAHSVPDAALFRQQWQGEHFGLLMIDPPALQAQDAEQLPARELILVVDTSGSMHGTSIEQARAALRLALQQLRPRDSFNLIQFNDRFARLFPRSVPADRRHLAQAWRYIDGLQAEGGTEMQPAMHAALSAPARPGALRQVVFLTDGDIGNEQALFETIHQDLGDARLFPVGIGSAPNGYFMTRAAAVGRGSYTFIGDIGEVGERMQRLFKRLSAPLLTDIRVTWQGAGEVDQVPSQVPDLYAGEPLWLSVRSGAALQTAIIEGSFEGRPWRREVALDGGAQAAGVHVLWARRRIAEIMAGRGLGGDREQLRQQVLSVALRHHLVSQYTSLVAVDKTPLRQADQPLASKPIPTHLPAGWSQAHVTGMPQTATPALLHTLLGLCILFAAAVLLWRRAA